VKIQRSPGQTAISISMAKEELTAIDARAASLNLPRSKYLALLAQRDIAAGGALTIESSSVSKLADAVVSSAMPATPLTVPVNYGSAKQAVRRSKQPRAVGSKKKV